MFFGRDDCSSRFGNTQWQSLRSGFVCLGRVENGQWGHPLSTRNVEQSRTVVPVRIDRSDEYTDGAAPECPAELSDYFADGGTVDVVFLDFTYDDRELEAVWTWLKC